MAKTTTDDMFSSRWGLVLTAMGAAIGTGNIWRFPKQAAANGGGAFLIAWVIFLFVWSIPLLLTEFAMGKHTRMGTVGSFGKLIGKKYTFMGAWMAFVSVAIGFYYAVVMGWVIRYFLVAASGGLAGGVDTQQLWASFITQPWLVVIFQFSAIAITAVIVHRGIASGIERANMFLMPTLFGLLIATMIWALMQPGALMGLRYLFVPRVEYLTRASTWINALSQSAWSCSAGMGMAITFAVYMKRREDTALNAVITGLGNNAISLIAGITVICTVFGLSANLAAANEAINADPTSITFIYLTKLFTQMPGGSIIAAVFFLGTAFAALTSMLSTYEIATRNFIDAGWSRAKAVKVLSVAIFVLGLPSAIIITNMDGLPMAAFLDNQDQVWGFGLILSGVFVAFTVWKYGVKRFRNELINTEWNDITIGKWWEYIVLFVFPTLFTALFSWYFYQTWTAPEQELWWLNGPIAFGLLIVQWFLVLYLLFKYRYWFARKLGL